MECGRPSQSVATLLSHGVAPEAFAALAALHFQPDPVDPLALTMAEEANYDRLVAAPTQTQRFWRLYASHLRSACHAWVVALARAQVASATSTCNVCAAAVLAGLHAITAMGMDLVTSAWTAAMRASRLTALYKTAARTDIQPMAA